jgi:cytochrome c5
MRHGYLHRGVVLSLAAAVAASLAACTPSPEQLAAGHAATVDQYCTDCHSAAEREADLVLENPDLANPAAQRAKWEAVVHKLSAGLMPPPGQPRPSDEAVTSLVSYLTTTLDATAPEPAGAPVRRLTRAAYGNAVRDLLGFPVDVETLLPADITSDGFDNVSDTLKTSPLLLERYLTVGLRVAAMAVGNTTLSPRGTEYRPRLDLSQNDWIEGLPFGTRGGLGRRLVERRLQIGHEARHGFVVGPRLAGRRHEPGPELVNHLFPLRAVRRRIR